MLFRSLASILILAVLSSSTAVAEPVTGNDPPLVLDNGNGLEFVLEKAGFRYGFRQKGGEFIVPAHPEAGLLAGVPGQLSPARSTKYLGKAVSTRYQLLRQAATVAQKANSY